MYLTEEQKQAVRNGDAVRISEDGLDCVVVRADVYDRVKTLCYDDNDWRDEELRLLLAKSTQANGWDEPGMDAYDNYDDEIQRRCQ